MWVVKNGILAKLAFQAQVLPAKARYRYWAIQAMDKAWDVVYYCRQHYERGMYSARDMSNLQEASGDALERRDRAGEELLDICDKLQAQFRPVPPRELRNVTPP
jgi:hypothetical protein